MDEHLGYTKHDSAGRNGGNSRNGTRSKTVITEVGPVDIDVPRDRDSTFEPATVKKRQRRLNGVDSMVISLTAKGLTTGEVQAHLAETYGTDVSRETISKITDRVLEDLAEWQNRPLDRVYPVIFIDAIVVKIRDGQVANRPVYTAIGVTVDGQRDILGLWVGTGGEGAKYWLQVLTEIKNRGVDDACIVVCDGLKGLPESIEATWPLAVVQTCVLHLIRNTFRLASRRDWDKMAKDLRPVYTAVNEADAQVAPRRVPRQMGRAISGDQDLVVQRLVRVRAVLGLLARDPPGHLLDERDRVVERQIPAGDPSKRALPQRAGRDEMPLHGRALARPDRHRPGTMDEPLEARPQRLRHHLRRPPLLRPTIQTSNMHRQTSYTNRLTVPSWRLDAKWATSPWRCPPEVSRRMVSISPSASSKP